MTPKFRAYFKKDDVMTSVDTISFLQGGIKVSDGCWHDEFLSDDVVLMQSTGMKDSSGKEIYEGDIIQYIDTVRETTRTLLVTFEYGCFWAAVYLLCDTFDLDVELSVIGNQYEEPNLLNRLDANWQELEEDE